MNPRHVPGLLRWQSPAPQLCLSSCSVVAFRSEIATPDVGLAAAGYAARAQDASTLYKNPAGMSLLEGTQLEGGLQDLRRGHLLQRCHQSLSRQRQRGNAIGALPAPISSLHQVSDRFSVGFGLFQFRIGL
jgi:long-chain fatty acid transport protein